MDGHILRNDTFLQTLKKIVRLVTKFYLGSRKKLVPCQSEYQSISILNCFKSQSSHNSNILYGAFHCILVKYSPYSVATGLNKSAAIIVVNSYLFQRDYVFTKHYKTNWNHQWHAIINPSNAFENEVIMLHIIL